MRALVWHGGRELTVDELAEPSASGDEVVLDVELAGICGSDLHAFRGHGGPRVPPLVLGHEVVGRAEGGTYTVYPLVSCGSCPRCLAGEDNLCPDWRLIGIHRQGVFADRVLVPRRSLVPVPPGLDPRLAVLAEPLACSVGALAPYGLGEGSDLVVLGAGPLGLLAVHLAARGGAHVTVVDPLPVRRETALRLGAAGAVATADELEPGASLVLDAAGFEPTWRAAIDAVRSGGTVVMLGLGQAEGVFPMAVLVRRGITLRGQFAYSRSDFARAVEVLAAGELDVDWLSTAPLDDGAQAFADLVDRPAEHTKVLLTP
jgi:threonine dehydrogenase-like Zn-dependent dehydrogenase